MPNQHYLRRMYCELDQLQRSALAHLIARNYVHIEEVYTERGFLLCAIATLALELGYASGIAPLPTDMVEVDNWRFLLVIDLPAGQVSFPLCDEQLPLFGSLPAYRGAWQGYPGQARQQHLLRYPGCQATKTDPMPAVSSPL